MRVAFVLGTTSGGTGRHVRMLADGLVRRGHRVLVVGPGDVEERFAFTEAGARFVPVRVSDRPHPLDDARSVLALRRLTRDADVVHAHGLRAGALGGVGLPGRGA
ncbi:glycosyltransferase, partial [Nonomuraea sp. NPDC050691]|uniref:glycosyltransferase n=1 Tax=Nonomuraea sp. NPDC050691 TaxID=3155661 RepID=UPI0033D324D8